MLGTARLGFVIVIVRRRQHAAASASDRIRSVRWLAILAATTARASARARAGSAKAWYWAARSATFLGGAGMTAAMNRP